MELNEIIEERVKVAKIIAKMDALNGMIDYAMNAKEELNEEYKKLSKEKQ